MASNKTTELQKGLCNLLTEWNQRAHQHNLPEIRGVWDSHGKIRFTARDLPDTPAESEQPKMPTTFALENGTDVSTEQLLQTVLPFPQAAPTHAPKSSDDRSSTTRFPRKKENPLDRWRSKLDAFLAVTMNKNKTKEKRVRVSTQLYSELVTAIEKRLEQRLEAFKDELRREQSG